MVSTRGVKFKFTEGEKVLCYEPDSSKAKVLYDSKVLELVVEKDNRGRKMPEYLIHFSGWNSSWDRCVAEEFILPDTPDNRKLQKRLAEEAAHKLLQTSRSKRRKVPAILKESLSRSKGPGEGGRRDRSDSSSAREDSSSDSDKSEREDQRDSDEAEEESDEEPDEVAREFELEIPRVLKERLEDDCYLVTCRSKLVRLPCSPSVVDLLEAYLRHYADRLTNTGNRNGGPRLPVVPPADIQARTRPPEEPDEAPECSSSQAADSAAVARGRSGKHNGTDARATSPPRRRTSGSPPERRTLRSSDRHPSGSSGNNSVNAGGSSPSKSANDESDSDNLPLAVAIRGLAHRHRTTSVCSATSTASTVPPDPPRTLAASLDCKLLPKESLEECPSSAALLYGPQHFLRLFVKLPELLVKMSLSKRKADHLHAILNGLLNYLAGEQEQLFQKSAYGDAELVMVELEKCAGVQKGS
ncbi:male-specific lethal 3 homolog isoform X2 [Ixodes scapularis]|uniref:male-specific lethal 3 homolog isoform X2 n=1 Tax=Ixodes scapularis TaxID=6945 RepID=UPI001A9F3D77|nr:male-specific lethal 3 homolog isoform X2 [Ixodes scapularis]